MKRCQSVLRTNGRLMLLIFIAGFLMFGIWVSGANAESTLQPQNQEIPNEQCLICHSVPGRTISLPDGEQLGITVDPDLFAHSVHAGNTCQTCHVDKTGYPHAELTVQNAKEFSLQFKETCAECHQEESTAQMDGAHAKLLEAGNTNAPVCSDCHNPHTTTPIQKDSSGKLQPAEHAKAGLVCANCHSTIYDEYVKSVHGQGVVSETNNDSPSCIDCHGVHNTAGPNSVSQFRLTSPQICAECHTNETMMAKYDLSTNVLRTYVSDFHGTTVQIFEKTDPDQTLNMPVCIDCHGVHNILSTKDPEGGLQVKQNVLMSCQKCHPDANENFPASWLNHYDPSPTKAPLVYYVELVYKILIPLVLGVMVFYIITDVIGKIRRRNKNTPDDGVPEVEGETILASNDETKNEDVGEMTHG